MGRKKITDFNINSMVLDLESPTLQEMIQRIEADNLAACKRMVELEKEGKKLGVDYFINFDSSEQKVTEDA